MPGQIATNHESGDTPAANTDAIMSVNKCVHVHKQEEWADSHPLSRLVLPVILLRTLCCITDDYALVVVIVARMPKT